MLGAHCTGRAYARPEELSPAALTAVRLGAEAFGLRERSSRLSLSCGRKSGSFAAALQGSYRCTTTLRQLAADDLRLAARTK